MFSAKKSNPLKILFVLATCTILGNPYDALVRSLDAQEIDLEEILEVETEGDDQSELVEYLQSLIERPLDINKVSGEELQTLPWITPILAHRIISKREHVGKFYRLEELQDVNGVDEDIYHILSHFLRIYETHPILPVWFTSRQRFSTRIEDPVGYTEKVYQGSKRKYYNRIRIGMGDQYELGVLSEKDPGEPRMLDLNLGFVKVRFPSLQSEIFVGNYKFEAGQGLVFWGPYGFGKSNDVISPIKKRGRGLREYQSVDENAGFRGVAVTSKIGATNLTGLYSSKSLDAGTTEEGEITAIYASGLHRTKTEAEKKDVAKETMFGLRAEYNFFNKGAIGVNFQNSEYSPSFSNGSNSWSSFRGTVNHIIGADYAFTIGRVDIFGEMARSRSGGTALISGLILDNDLFDLAFSIRRYDKNFHAPHGFAFAEKSGDGQNETGIYLGLFGKLSTTTRASFFFDLFKYPWPTSIAPLPTSGFESMALIDQKLGRGLSLLARVRIKEKEDTIVEENDYHQSQNRLALKRRINGRLQLTFDVTSRLRVRSRVEKIWIQWDSRYGPTSPFSPSAGVLLFQELKLTPSKRLSLNYRISFFDTESYDARIYQYEASTPGVWSSKLLYGRGTRWYALIKFRLLNWLTIYGKYSITYYDDRDSIGTGWERIDGSRDRRLDLQLDWRFD